MRNVINEVYVDQRHMKMCLRGRHGSTYVWLGPLLCVYRFFECSSITKTYLYNFDPLKPHFYIVTLRFTGVYIIFLISAQNINYGYSLEPPRRGGSNRYHNLYFEQKYEKYQNFLSENFRFLVVNVSAYLNRRVFVMNILVYCIYCIVQPLSDCVSSVRTKTVPRRFYCCRSSLFVRVVFVCFLFLLVSGKGCGLWLWHSLYFSFTFNSYVMFVLSLFEPHLSFFWCHMKALLLGGGIFWVYSLPVPLANQNIYCLYMSLRHLFSWRGSFYISPVIPTYI